MLTIAAQVIGVLVFVSGTAVLGLRIRRQPNRAVATHTLRLNRLLSRRCLFIPGLTGVFYPGLTWYDDLLGLPPLPNYSITAVVGLIALLSGLYLWIRSRRRTAWENGRPAHHTFLKLAKEDPYKYVRNPMALGCYLGGLGAGLLVGSTAITLGNLLIIIPAHVFNLHFFEERARETLYGSAYAAYQRRVPSLIPRCNALRNATRS